jgi:hypothetical protein
MAHHQRFLFLALLVRMESRIKAATKHNQTSGNVK